MTSGLHSHPELPDGIEPPQRPPEPERGSLAAVPIWAPLAGLLIAFVAAAFAAVLIGAAIEAGGGSITEGDTPPGLLIGATFVQDLALIAAAALLANIWSRGVTPATFGLRPVKIGPAIGWTLVGWGLFLVASLIYFSLVGQPEDQELTRDLNEEDSLSALIGYAVLLAFMAPLAEEIFFRGFVFGVLREKLGVAAGALTTGIVFGLVHATGSPIETLGVLVILGVVLCWLYEQTGSILPCIALHALNNGLSFAVTKDIPAPGAVALVLGCAAAAVAVAAAVTRRSPALPGAPRTP
jgi:membrane protease YdiL (CAAX protease family)